jgi:hypothetical protein
MFTDFKKHWMVMMAISASCFHYFLGWEKNSSSRKFDRDLAE